MSNNELREAVIRAKADIDAGNSSGAQASIETSMAAEEVIRVKEAFREDNNLLEEACVRLAINSQRNIADDLGDEYGEHLESPEHFAHEVAMLTLDYIVLIKEAIGLPRDDWPENSHLSPSDFSAVLAEIIQEEEDDEENG